MLAVRLHWGCGGFAHRAMPYIEASCDDYSDNLHVGPLRRLVSAPDRRRI